MKQGQNLDTGVFEDTVYEHLRTQYNTYAQPRLTFDWNWNRYTPTECSNVLDEPNFGFNPTMCPIDSIAEPLRPDKGAAKAIVNQATVSHTYTYTHQPRFYPATEDDKYKYWVSPYTTNNNGNFPKCNEIDYTQYDEAVTQITDGLTTARPKIEYPEGCKANKIVIRFENTWATPKDYRVMVKPGAFLPYALAGGENPRINAAKGKVTLYFNGTAWVDARPATLVETPVWGIELQVDSMGPGVRRNGATMWYRPKAVENAKYASSVETDGTKSSLCLISIEPHLEVDFTDRLMEVSDSFEMSDKSQLYPVGTITSNTAELVVSNYDQELNIENTASDYYRLMDANANVILEYIFNINGTEHAVGQFDMYVESWPSSSDDTVSLSLTDFSKFLKEIKPRPMLIEGKTAAEIVWRILDFIGFTNYQIADQVETVHTEIPVFWTTGEETVWEVLDQIAQATQTAIYIDSFGKLQIQTRQTAFKESNDVDWSLLGQKKADAPANIVSWSPTNEYESNKIQVGYKKTKWKTNSLGQPAMSKVWEPEGDSLVVRSCQLVRDIVDDSQFIHIGQKECKIWNSKGIVQIDGEIISYDGKQFAYYVYYRSDVPFYEDDDDHDNPFISDEYPRPRPRDNNTWPPFWDEGDDVFWGDKDKTDFIPQSPLNNQPWWNEADEADFRYPEDPPDSSKTTLIEVKKFGVVKTQADFKKYNELTPKSKRHKNYYTGGLQIVERGMWGTRKRNHTIELDGWGEVKREINGGPYAGIITAPWAGVTHNRQDSTITIDTPARIKDTKDFLWLIRGSVEQEGYRAFGTRFKFEPGKDRTDQVAGFAFNLHGLYTQGYYVTLRCSKNLNGKDRKHFNEVSISHRRLNRQFSYIAKGKPVAIAPDVWYDLDIYVNDHPGEDKTTISVSINGKQVAFGTTKHNDPDEQYEPPNGRFALFARGKTKITFEYAYAIKKFYTDPADDYGFYDLVYGGIRGGQWEREFVWKMRSRPSWTVPKDTLNLTKVPVYFFDEFGPYVHEVRQFDVEFDPNPVRYSYLFNTNEWYSAVPEYRSNPFGAQFIIANTSRHNAILQGEDKLIYAGAGSAVNQVCTVLGQNLEIADEETVTVKNDRAIKARGVIESELSSDWLQSKDAAKQVSDWMARHWSKSVDEVEVEIYGNPLIEIGDVVDVDYDKEDAKPSTHVYFVVGTSSTFEKGITTTLTLRRRRLADPFVDFK